MNRNTESRFAINPTSLDRPRASFNRDSNVRTSFNVGDLIPIYCDEVYPGDTHKVRTNMLLRTSSPFVVPPMDDMFIDTYYFFVPMRLTWQHTVNFFGENTESAWVPETTYQIPQMTAPAGGWQVGSLADYFGIPTGISGISVNALPFRAYALIYNDYFRDQNLQDPINYNLDDTTVQGVNDLDYSDPIANCVLGGCPMRVCKLHDYYSSCLPSAQKGSAVLLPLGDLVGGVLPVTTNRNFDVADLWPVGMHYKAYSSQSGEWVPVPDTLKRVQYVQWTGTSETPATPDNSYAMANIASNDSTAATSQITTMVPSNLSVDMSNLSFSSNATINDLRIAFQLQKYYETLARGGSRYPEWLKSMFGVVSPDARQQRPEYLGGSRTRIGINTITQTSASDGTQYQGRQSAYSVTMDSDKSFTKSFTEHGFIIGVACVRYKHSYQQGLNRMWTRLDSTDYYNPLFANIGEQPVLNREIYCQGNSEDNEVFGFQEAWADLRYKPSIITGEMRSQYETSLDVYHFGDYYNSRPSLSSQWIEEDKSVVDRALYVNSSVSNQFVADFYFKNSCTRVMPLYSIPGLIDHH